MLLFLVLAALLPWGSQAVTCRAALTARYIRAQPLLFHYVGRRKSGSTSLQNVYSSVWTIANTTHEHQGCSRLRMPCIEVQGTVLHAHVINLQTSDCRKDCLGHALCWFPACQLAHMQDPFCGLPYALQLMHMCQLCSLRYRGSWVCLVAFMPLGHMFTHGGRTEGATQYRCML